VVASCLQHRLSALVVCTYLTNPLLTVLQVYVFSLEPTAIFYQLSEERRPGKWAIERNISIHIRHDEWTEHLTTSLLQYWPSSICKFCLKPCLSGTFSEIEPESRQNRSFWDYSLEISFILHFIHILSHHSIRTLFCTISALWFSALLPYTERFDILNENYCMLIVQMCKIFLW